MTAALILLAPGGLRPTAYGEFRIRSVRRNRAGPMDRGRFDEPQLCAGSCGITRACFAFAAIPGFTRSAQTHSHPLLSDAGRAGAGSAPMHSPMGLDTGADGAEQIALSVIAEIQAVINQRRAADSAKRPALSIRALSTMRSASFSTVQ